MGVAVFGKFRIGRFGRLDLQRNFVFIVGFQRVAAAKAELKLLCLGVVNRGQRGRAVVLGCREGHGGAGHRGLGLAVEGR